MGHASRTLHGFLAAVSSFKCLGLLFGAVVHTTLKGSTLSACHGCPQIRGYEDTAEIGKILDQWIELRFPRRRGDSRAADKRSDVRSTISRRSEEGGSNNDRDASARPAEGSKDVDAADKGATDVHAARRATTSCRHMVHHSNLYSTTGCCNHD